VRHTGTRARVVQRRRVWESAVGSTAPTTFHGHVITVFDPHHGYQGPHPDRGERPLIYFHGNEQRDGAATQRGATQAEATQAEAMQAEAIARNSDNSKAKWVLRSGSRAQLPDGWGVHPSLDKVGRGRLELGTGQAAVGHTPRCPTPLSRLRTWRERNSRAIFCPFSTSWGIGTGRS